MKNTTNTFGVVFYLRKYKTASDGKAPIYARITVDGKRVDLSVKQRIEEKSWNGSKGMAKGSREEIRALNAYLEKARAGIVACYQEMLLQKKLVTAEAVKNKFLGTDNKERTLGRLMDYHNTTMKDKLVSGTLVNFFTTRKYVLMFLKEKYKTSDMYLAELTYQFIMDFEFFLRNHLFDNHRPLRNNGAMKHIERLHKMIRMAVRMEWLDKDPFARYRKKFEKRERGFLTKEELAALESGELAGERLQSVRDMFIFSCYTGLAYIDMAQLTPENVTTGMDGEQWIVTSRKKTGSPVRVPLLPQALAMIEKYREHPCIQMTLTKPKHYIIWR